MSGLKNTVQKFANASKGQGFKTHEQRGRKRREIAADIARDEVYSGAAVPDDELLKRNERRKAAKRQGSRANTVLTNNDQLG